MRWLVLATLGLCAGAQDRVPEPREMRVVYARTAPDKLEPLPELPVRYRKDAEGERAWLEGEESSVRFPEDRLPEFVITVYAGKLSPGYIRFYRLEPQGGRRTTPLARRGSSAPGRTAPGMLGIEIVPYGKLSYQLKINPQLAPGEYAFSRPDGGYAFTFGVDPAAGK